MVWRNGQIPESDLVIFKRGWNPTDGNWYWGFTPGTYHRHLALLDLGFRNTGRWLSPSDGWSTVRPLFAQEIARRLYGNGAAKVGTSSHGGFWEGQETLACDYGNWAWVYANAGGRAAFFRDCRAVGLSPGLISPERGYPDEPWHVIDKKPRSLPAPAAGGSSPFTPKPVETRRKGKRMFSQVMDVPNGTIAVQCIPGGALTLLGDPVEYAAMVAATGIASRRVTDGQLAAEIQRYGTVPWPLFDNGTETLRILAPEDGGDSRYGQLGTRAWPLANISELAALQHRGIEVLQLPQAEIDAMLAWRGF